MGASFFSEVGMRGYPDLRASRFCTHTCENFISEQMVGLQLQKHSTSEACGLLPAKQQACPVLLSMHRWAKPENRSAHPSRGQSPSEKHDEQFQ